MNKVCLAVAALLFNACPSTAQHWSVQPRWVKAHENFLANDVLQGRGSATRDEHIAAVYVGSQFESFGLKNAPGMRGFVQTVPLRQPQLDAHATLKASGLNLEEAKDFRILASSGETTTGALVRVKGKSPQQANIRKGVALLLDFGDMLPNKIFSGVIAAHKAGCDLILIRGGPAIERALGGMPNAIRSSFADGTKAQIGSDVGTVLLLEGEASGRVATLKDGTPITLAVRATKLFERATYNAVGFLRGTDRQASALLITSHLDHLGVGKPVAGDAIYNGADDDASGTTAVLELARALAAGPRMRRSVLFVCFGSEELGGYGNAWFQEHSPIPLSQFIANVEFEMIGAQDPKMPKGILLLTGWERSNLGPVLRQHGAKLGPDPYPEQHFFERSDNYALATKGIVAHTAAGYGAPPYYHRPDDDIRHLDIAFMTAAIQSLIEPIRWLANSDFQPQWNPGGKP